MDIANDYRSGMHQDASPYNDARPYTSGFYAGYSEANFKLNEAYGEDQTGCRVSKQNTFKKASCSNITSERRRSSVRI